MEIENFSGRQFSWYYLFSKRVNGYQGDGLLSVDTQAMPYNSQWLVLRIGGADFLNCRVADSM